MSTIDIRKERESPPTSILFAEADSGTYHATSISKDIYGYHSEGEIEMGRIRIQSQDSIVYTYVNGKQEAEDLIKSLELAIKLKWVS